MFFRNLEKYHIILGSKSPRRLQLLKETGINPEVLVLNGDDEDYPSHLSEIEIPVFLAKKKANPYINIIQNTNKLVITADTIVWINNQVVGKPENRIHAVEILQTLSGKWHQVITGVCLTTHLWTKSFHVTTDVLFKVLSMDEINYYLDHYQPYDKAGAYGIQEWIGYIAIKEIKGSYFNVMGLPIQRLTEEFLTI